MYRQSPQLSTCPTVQQSLCVGISSSHTVSCLRRRSNFVWWWSRRRSRCSVKPTKPADIKRGIFLQEGHKNNENNSDHNNGKDSCYTIVNRCWYCILSIRDGYFSGVNCRLAHMYCCSFCELSSLDCVWKVGCLFSICSFYLYFCISVLFMLFRAIWTFNYQHRMTIQSCLVNLQSITYQSSAISSRTF